MISVVYPCLVKGGLVPGWSVTITVPWRFSSELIVTAEGESPIGQ